MSDASLPTRNPDTRTVSIRMYVIDFGERWSCFAFFFVQLQCLLARRCRRGQSLHAFIKRQNMMTREPGFLHHSKRCPAQHAAICICLRTCDPKESTHSYVATTNNSPVCSPVQMNYAVAAENLLHHRFYEPFAFRWP